MMKCRVDDVLRRLGTARLPYPQLEGKHPPSLCYSWRSSWDLLCGQCGYRPVLLPPDPAWWRAAWSPPRGPSWGFGTHLLLGQPVLHQTARGSSSMVLLGLVACSTTHQSASSDQTGELLGRVLSVTVVVCYSAFVLAMRLWPGRAARELVSSRPVQPHGPNEHLCLSQPDGSALAQDQEIVP